jgi:hypothetical protein
VTVYEEYLQDQSIDGDLRSRLAMHMRKNFYLPNMTMDDVPDEVAAKALQTGNLFRFSELTIGTTSDQKTKTLAIVEGVCEAQTSLLATMKAAGLSGRFAFSLAGELWSKRIFGRECRVVEGNVVAEITHL